MSGLRWEKDASGSRPALVAEIRRLRRIETAAWELPDHLATNFYTDDPVIPYLHQLWATLGRELPAPCICSFCMDRP